MTEPLLAVASLDSSYGMVQALFGVSLTLAAGERLALIGANGAGKSTLFKSIIGLLPARADAVRFEGRPVGGLPTDTLVARGIALVPEGRRLFGSMTVEENLLVAGQLKRPGPWTLDTVYALFPALAAKRQVTTTLLSGGQQQMVAIGRALMTNPRLLLLDEISLGLAPLVVEEIYASLPATVSNGTAAILVEQDIGRALSSTDRYLCMREGRIVLEGPAAGADRAAIIEAYFGSKA